MMGYTSGWQKKETAGNERNDKFNREKCWYAPAGGAPYLLKDVSSGQQQQQHSTGAISTYTVPIYKFISKSFEANSFPISWQKGFALYVQIYRHTDLSVCVFRPIQFVYTDRYPWLSLII